ncbi:MULTISPECIES: ABC transporter permease [Clostridium]|uniref:Predicted permease n=1 Tax=Clostridium acetobutylicum (strain ATCC 824 / DSM 792 / JCM 1419 / IAM 19013 / LMG 5710 / NBRC 13948 / NRRL B-527 / VKM B-1787 / 2291 / W) TaxID=272562 RepID=Q97MF6_CLOAB|nr:MULTISPECIES: ABC transporter permease [Clostridium]AAK78223.1 Predicted permease [Clostridium acetobutylicum ATCC 824]ADZ19289.1 permease [Clostridium acetobutylicum EA 2018]AEI34467.1 permease [Clostridium acetobutylicum DSM 1731]AWV82031.1 ABC transporter permease [Clostridium acetobutylicum]MBC2396077.1 ABC transporter permease [Clostridium acetobutylicum]
MNVFYIAINTIKSNISDKKTLIMMLLMPIVIILILGNALKSVDNFSVTNLGKTTVYYYNADNKEISKNFDEFLKNKSIKDILNVKKVSSYKKGKELVDKGEGNSLIYINSNYSDNIEANKKGRIEIYESKSSTTRNQIIKSLIDSFNDGANTVEVSSQISRMRTSYVEKNNISKKYLSVNGKSPRAIDYYSVTMLMMILLYGANYGSAELENLFFDRVGKRIKTTATKTYQHLLGVVLGVIFTLILQAVVLVLFTKYVYGANWGGHPILVLGIVSSFAILAASIGFLFMIITGDDKRASMLISVTAPIFTFVSGGYVKVPFSDGSIIKYVPNNLAQSGLFNMIYKGVTSTAENSIIILLGMSIVLLAIASIVGRRRVA